MKKFAEYTNRNKEEISDSIMDVVLDQSVLHRQHNVSMLESFSKNYNSFNDNIKKVDSLIEEFAKLSETTENLVKREELESLFISHLVLVNENIEQIKYDIKGINQSDILDINNFIDSIDNKTQDLVEFVNRELPKHKRLIIENDISINKKIDNLVGNIQDTSVIHETLDSIELKLEDIDSNYKISKNKLYEVEKDISKKINSLEESLTESLVDNQSIITDKFKEVNSNISQSLIDVDSKIEIIEENLFGQQKSTKDLKSEVTRKISDLYTEVKTTNSSISILSEKYDDTILSAIEKINEFEKNINSVDSVVSEYYSNLDHAKAELKQVVNEVNTLFVNEKYIELDDKVQQIQEIFESLTKQSLLEDTRFSKQATDVTPASEIHSTEELKRIETGKTFQQPNPELVEANFKAIQNKMRFMEQAIGRIAATGPGGGEVNLRWLDDIDRSTIADGLFLRYNDTTKNFGFAPASPIDNPTFTGTITTPALALTNTNNQLLATTGVEAWTYNAKVSNVAQDGEARDLYFSPDGTKLFIVGNTNNAVFRYDLSTAWSITTAVYVSTFSVATQGLSPYGLAFSPDGLNMFIADASSPNSIYRYTLSTAWDITTAVYLSSFSVITQDTAISAIDFSSDGLNMYMTGNSSDAVHQYTLSTAWDITTAVWASSVSYTTYEGTAQGLSFAQDGTKFWVIGTQYYKILEYTLSTAWDVSTATFTDFSCIYNEPVLGPTAINGVSGIYVNVSAGKAYLTDYNTDNVLEYDTNVSVAKMTGTKLVVNPSTYFKNDINVNGNIHLNYNLATPGTITGASFVGTNFAASSAATACALMYTNTTGALSFYTAQTTGVLTVGGTAATGLIQIGRSTQTQTIAIGTGVTASGSTKTIQIGTVGASGSTTTITIGSSTSGALGSTTIYGNVGLTSITTGASLSVNKSITGGVTSYGTVVAATIQSDVTSNANMFLSLPSTIAATFTLGALRHFYASQNTFGLNSVVTNQFGFVAELSLIGATNNYGFYGNIPAATGRYNLYMNGTADNYLAGRLGIGATPIVYETLTVGKNLTGFTSTKGIVSNGQIQSDSTTSSTYFAATSSTQAATFNTTYLELYSASQGTFGVNSTVTNQYGFAAGASLIGATNNYGFFGNIPASAGTNRYNLYMVGTAPNYLAGDLQLAKTVTATGTTGAQTINKTTGTVNFAAAATSLVVTNSLVSASSIIIATVGSNDTTMKSVAVVAGTGSFTLYANAAPTAETRVNFLITN